MKKLAFILLSGALLLNSCGNDTPKNASVPSATDTKTPTVIATPSHLTVQTDESKQTQLTLTNADDDDISISGQPEGLITKLNGTTLTVSNYGAANGTYPLTLTVTTESGRRNTSTLMVTTTTAPKPTTADFTLSAAPAGVRLDMGQAVQVKLSITPLNGFNGNVTYSVEDSPSGTGATIDGDTLTLMNAAAFDGDYSMLVTATSGTIHHTIVVPVVIQKSTTSAPDFIVSLSRVNLELAQGQSGDSYIAIIPLRNFNSPVTRSVSGQPAGMSAVFNGENLTVTNQSAPSGTYVLKITVAGGGVTHTRNLTVTVP